MIQFLLVGAMLSVGFVAAVEANEMEFTEKDAKRIQALWDHPPGATGVSPV